MENLGAYLTNGVENIVKEAIEATLTDPRESAFMARFALSSKAASRKRAQLEKIGENIPPFLIASITSACNLHCAGCYSRQNHACTDAAPVDQLTDKDWQNIFAEAKELGDQLYPVGRRRAAAAQRRDRDRRRVSGYPVSHFHKRNPFERGIY